MARRIALFVAAALASAALFIRLGVWQLHRLAERRQRNAVVASRLDSAITTVAALPRDPESARFRRVRVAGTPDWAHELVLAGRTRQGSPGVHLLTPVRVPGSDTAVIVDRGWVYSPDAATVDPSRWHESDTTWTGFVLPWSSEGGPGPAASRERPRLLRRAERAAVARALPYPVASVYVVALADTGTPPRPDRPARLGVPPLDDGPHRSYAFQWFGFAAVALIGAGVVVARGRRADG